MPGRIAPDLRNRILELYAEMSDAQPSVRAAAEEVAANTGVSRMTVMRYVDPGYPWLSVAWQP